MKFVKLSYSGNPCVSLCGRRTRREKKKKKWRRCFLVSSVFWGQGVTFARRVLLLRCWLFECALSPHLQAKPCRRNTSSALFVASASGLAKFVRHFQFECLGQERQELHSASRLREVCRGLRHKLFSKQQLWPLANFAHHSPATRAKCRCVVVGRLFCQGTQATFDTAPLFCYNCHCVFSYVSRMRAKCIACCI